jgi:hypothetical protein
MWNSQKYQFVAGEMTLLYTFRKGLRLNGFVMLIFALHNARSLSALSKNSNIVTSASIVTSEGFSFVHCTIAHRFSLTVFHSLVFINA